MSSKSNKFLDEVWDLHLPAVLQSSWYAQQCERSNHCLTATGVAQEAADVMEAAESKYFLAVGLNFPPFDMLGSLDVTEDKYQVEGFSNEVALLVCEHANVTCEFVVDNYDYCWGGHMPKAKNVWYVLTDVASETDPLVQPVS